VFIYVYSLREYYQFEYSVCNVCTIWCRKKSLTFAITAPSMSLQTFYVIRRSALGVSSGAMSLWLIANWLKWFWSYWNETGLNQTRNSYCTVPWIFLVLFRSKPVMLAFLNQYLPLGYKNIDCKLWKWVSNGITCDLEVFLLPRSQGLLGIAFKDGGRLDLISLH